MASINTFTLIGNLTADVNLTSTQSGLPTCTYEIAVSNVWFDRTGGKHEECDLIPITTYGKQAEDDARYLGKGATVCVFGSLRTWYDKEAKKGGFVFEAARVQYLISATSNNGNINTFTVLGNLTRDVVLRSMPNGTPTCTYSVAVNNVWFDATGAKHEECDFIPITTYGQQAENDAKYLAKGATVAAIGSIRSWESAGKSGFNFVTESVQYIRKQIQGGGNSERHNGDTPPPDANDQWRKDYDAAEQGGPVGFRK